MPALMALGMAQATPENSGLVSGLFNATQQMGAALGLATLLVLATARTEDLRADGEPHASALLGGYHLAYALGIALVLTSLLLTLLLRTQPARPPAGPSAVKATSTASPTGKGGPHGTSGRFRTTGLSGEPPRKG